MPEYLKYRCCMCPNIGEPSAICPGIEKPLPCRFVKSYIDNRGWKYQVMSGLGEASFIARYQDDKHSGDNGWYCCRQLLWRKSFDTAQADLNRLAESKGWGEWNGKEASHGD